MKTSNRIRLNGSTRKLAAQPIREPGISSLGHYSGAEPICLTVFDHKSDDTLAGCDIKADEWASIRAQAALQGKSVGDLLKYAICEIAGGVRTDLLQTGAEDVYRAAKAVHKAQEILSADVSFAGMDKDDLEEFRSRVDLLEASANNVLAIAERLERIAFPKSPA